MLEAVIHGKADMGKILEGAKRHPREDLVTSSIIGAIRFLSKEDQGTALTAIIGHTIADIDDIFLWPRFSGAGSSYVEPDVVVKYGPLDSPTFWVIEVKWGSILSADQADKELISLRSGRCMLPTFPKEPRRVGGYTLLGAEPKHSVDMQKFRQNHSSQVRVTSREWSDVTRELSKMGVNLHASGSLRAWACIVRDFLHKLPQGRILDQWPMLTMPGFATYTFK